MMTIPLYSFAAMYICWVLYLAVMNLKRARDNDTLSTTAKVFGYPLLFVGLALDVALNLTLYSVLLLELPKSGEWTVSARTKRHFYGSTGFRHVIAFWIAESLLNAFDPDGRHI